MSGAQFAEFLWVIQVAGSGRSLNPEPRTLQGLIPAAARASSAAIILVLPISLTQSGAVVLAIALVVSAAAHALPE
ncbi:MAG: hypothetical protein AB1Z38_14140, partial [Desulfotignum sp.]